MEEKKEVIEISLELQREIAKVFKVTEQCKVQCALKLRVLPLEYCVLTP